MNLACIAIMYTIQPSSGCADQPQTTRAQQVQRWWYALAMNRRASGAVDGRLSSCTLPYSRAHQVQRWCWYALAMNARASVL